MVVIVSSFMTAFMGSALNIAVPSMSSDLHISAGDTGWIISVYALVTSAMSVPFGKIADSTGFKRVFVVGLVMMTAGSLCAGSSETFINIMVMRVIQSIGAAMIFATNTAIISGNYPPQERGKAMGLMLSGTYVGLSSGPALGGIINHWTGWHGIFLFSGSVSLFAFVLALIFLKETKNAAGFSGGKDIAGNVLFVAMILLAMSGFASVGEGLRAWILLASGTTLAFVFVRVELSAEDPVIDVRIFKGNPAYTLSNISALFNYCATFGISYLMSIYLQTDLGFSSQTSGLILLCQPVVTAAMTPVMGARSDRTAPWKLATLGMGICGVCLACFALLVRHGTPLFLIIALLLVTGAGMSVFSSPNMNAIMSCVTRQHYGIASSILATMRTLGQNAGMCIITIIVNARLADLPLAKASSGELEGCMHIAFAIFAVICFCGMFMSMQRSKT